MDVDSLTGSDRGPRPELDCVSELYSGEDLFYAYRERSCAGDSNLATVSRDLVTIANLTTELSLAVGSPSWIR